MNPKNNHTRTVASLLIGIVFTLAFPFASMHAQEFHTQLGNNLSLGGRVGLATGSTSNDIDVLPVLTYYVNAWVSAGIAPSYQYRSIKGSDREIHILSGRAFVHAYPIPQLSLQLEYEFSHYRYNQSLPSRNIQNLLLGGGFRYPIAAKTYATASILFYLLPNEYTPTNNPVYRAGVDYML